MLANKVFKVIRKLRSILILFFMHIKPNNFIKCKENISVGVYEEINKMIVHMSTKIYKRLSVLSAKLEE